MVDFAPPFPTGGGILSCLPAGADAYVVRGVFDASLVSPGSVVATSVVLECY
ncbi:MAG: hypothetical protein QF464_01060 [Myxococcota bacterium]|nr:hypothetical protein [Myxococcota bacterium]